jgi:hypothetical protein
LTYTLRPKVLILFQCDEARPSCANCIKYGASCPGYDKGLKFVVGKTHRSRRQQRTYLKQQKTISFSPSSESPSPVDCSSIVPFQQCLPSPPQSSTSPELQLAVLHRHYEDPPEPFICFSISSPTSYQAQCLSILVDHLPKQNGSSDILIMSRWMSFLPSRFGRSKALDTAIACFTTQQIGTSQNDQKMLGYGRSAYVQALGRLQKAINSPTEAGTSDTLCAAMLLCIYEVSITYST